MTGHQWSTSTTLVVGEWLPGITSRGASWKIERVLEDGGVIAVSDFGKRSTIPAERVQRMVALRSAFAKAAR